MVLLLISPEPPPIRPTHSSCPAAEYFAMKTSESPTLVSCLTPLPGWKSAVPLKTPATMLLPVESTATAVASSISGPPSASAADSRRRGSRRSPMKLQISSIRRRPRVARRCMRYTSLRVVRRNLPADAAERERGRRMEDRGPKVEGRRSKVDNRALLRSSILDLRFSIPDPRTGPPLPARAGGPKMARGSRHPTPMTRTAAAVIAAAPAAHHTFTARLTIAGIVTVTIAAALVGCARQRAPQVSDPHAVDAYVRAVGEYHSGNDARAIRDLQLATRANPNLMMAHSLLGDLYRSHGNLEGAAKEYQDTVRLD